MKKTYYIYFSLFVLLLIASCSTRKDAALNRGFHSMNTKYNILYNGNIAFERGVDELDASYADDYWSRLPIEPLKIDELAIPGVDGNPDNSNASFDRAEEKAVKAVQKHSMNISGSEKNKQIDDAFLLLGKARYYSQRFVPSLEAFNYIIKNYPTSDLIDETRIWRAKTHMRMQIEELALQDLQLIFDKEELLEESIIEDGHTAFALVYTAMDSIDLVIYHLKKAIETNNDIKQTARNTFVLAQIYAERDELESSNIAFQKVIDMKRIPYKYVIHSEIEKSKNITDGTDIIALISNLTKLINDRYNRPYLDELHYQSGLVHQKAGMLAAAEDHFMKSAHAVNAKQFQQALAYEQLGNMSFDKASFVNAGAFYDSVLQIPQDRNTKRYRKLERKRRNLEEVIFYENTAQVTDSILNIVNMSSEEQELFFNDHIAKLKAADELEQQRMINTGFGGFGDDNSNQFSGDGKWYFYNNQVSGFGVQSFQRTWGNRPLEDNWRLSNRSVIGGPALEEEEAEITIEDSKKYDLEAYMERIPTDEEEINLITSDRNEAYYQLGLIYKEQFNENELAANRLENLLTFSPDKKYILPAKYHLYQIYLEINPIKAENYKNDIVSNHSDSKYAKLILNPEEVLAASTDENSPENVYKKIYYDYQDEKYEEVIVSTENAIIQYEDSPILPKFELLRAYAIGKRDGVEAFRIALEYVALNYSNTEEGKKATEVIETINKL